MITADQLEILLRSVPQYLLFGALALYVIGWMNKKAIYGLIAEILLSITGVVLFTVMVSGLIPSPKTPGINEEHVKLVIRMLLMFSGLGFLSIISLIIRLINKKPFNPLIVAIFILAVILFYESTRISRVKFELNKPQTEITDSIN
jgi:hypothetical protein